MCDFKGHLIAWMDGELASAEAAGVEEHVRICAECRARVAAYADTSREFAAYYAASAQRKVAAVPPRSLPRWVPAIAAVAAAVVVALLLLPRGGNVRQIPAAAVAVQASAAVPVMETQAPAAVETVAKTVLPMRRRHSSARKNAPVENWEVTGPAILIEIPAAEMFPPGAVPEGATYIANLSLSADGAVQGLRLQP
jgi:anti-sigma factor RsiW